MIRVKNEEMWIATSLLSLNNFADEVIIIDNGSTDKTVREIEKIRDSLSYPIILQEDRSDDICAFSNKALKLTSFRWIFRWDADFIAYTSGKKDIANLRNFLLSLNQKNFYLIYPLTLSFSGDLFHVKRNYELHSENYIHTFHPSLHYIQKRFFEVLKTPFFFKIIRIPKIYFVHIGTVKPFERLIYRFFWLFWLKEKAKYPTIEDFIKKEAENKYDSLDIKSIAKKKMDEIIISKVRKYNKKEFGEYPELLKPFLEDPPFKIIYQNGKPVSRSDIH